jgi:predicted PurR-regulated permease PerM
MKRTSKVRIWASIIVPIVMGLLFNFWGVLLAPPLLAVFYAYRGRKALEPQINAEGRDKFLQS